MSTPAPMELLIEQYKAFIGDLGNIGSRHTQTNTLYVSIISALLVFLSLTESGKALANFDMAGQVAVSLLGIFLCLAWYFHVKSFGYLYKAKFDVLREMEQDLPYSCYKRELDFLDPKFFRFTKLEGWLTLLLSLPFIVLLVHSLLKINTAP